MCLWVRVRPGLLQPASLLCVDAEPAIFGWVFRSSDLCVCGWMGVGVGVSVTVMAVETFFHDFLQFSELPIRVSAL